MPLHLNLDAFEPGVHLLDLTEDVSSFGFARGEVEFVEPLHLALQVVRDGSTVVVGGHVAAKGRMTCARCLASLTSSIEADVHEIYHLVEGPAPFRTGDDEELHFVNRRASRVDIAPAIREQLLLEIPIKVLCSEACRGLCPVCGVNRNEEACRCEAPAGDARWNAFRGLAPGGEETGAPGAEGRRSRSTRGEEKS
jgi:DUF177 domain-containing protein